MKKPVIVVHAGAGTVPEEHRAPAREGVLIAVNKAWEILRDGGSSIEAVEKAVIEMENFPNFNAGKGSVLTADGKVEMDALIMDGSNLGIGGVIAVSRIKNPIRLARGILEKSAHVLFAGSGAEIYAKEIGFELIEQDELITESVKERLEKFLMIEGGYGSYIESDDPERREKYGTVGAVALDSDGNFAAATSTGGVLGKKFGRVGDTALPGAGTFADKSMAFSATGVGEVIIRSMLGMEVKSRLKDFDNPKEASMAALSYMQESVQGHAGLIIISEKGWSASKTTKDLIYAARDGTMEDFHDFSLDE